MIATCCKVTKIIDSSLLLDGHKSLWGHENAEQIEQHIEKGRDKFDIQTMGHISFSSADTIS